MSDEHDPFDPLNETANDAPEAVPMPSIHVDFRSSAPTAFAVGGETLVLTPGLNVLVASTWSSIQGHPPIVARRGSDELRGPVDLGVLSSDDRLDLVSRTRSLEGVRVILDAEMAKPLVAGPSRRRSAAVVELAKRKLASLTKKAKV